MAEVTEIAADVFRISVHFKEFDIRFNQFLVRDREPLLYHTGMKGMFPEVRDAVATVLDPKTLRWLAFSHFESDECGALNEFLALAPAAQGLCSFVGAVVNVNDFAIRPVRGLQDGEVVTTGERSFRFLRTPHLPHTWEAGHLFEETRRVLFSSDLFHQDGDVEPLITSKDELMKRVRSTLERYQQGPFSNYLPYTPNTEAQLRKLGALRPEVIAAMHGSAFKGDGAAALQDLGQIFREVVAKSA